MPLEMKAENRPPAGTADPEEVERFSRLAGQWWDPEGKFRPLHRINPLRIGYIRDWTARHFEAAGGGRRAAGEKESSFLTPRPAPLAALSLLDIGCGGGLVCEPMARLGAAVTGIDAAEKNIGVARTHAEQSGLSIDYRCMTAEALAETGAQFDVVLALEIVEHVADVTLFVEQCARLVKPGGLFFLSTINRTLRAYGLAIFGAEYILRWLPRGTHTFEKFLRPSEVHAHLRKAGLSVIDMQGMVFRPLRNEWTLTPEDVSVNYLLAARKD